MTWRDGGRVARRGAGPNSSTTEPVYVVYKYSLLLASPLQFVSRSAGGGVRGGAETNCPNDNIHRDLRRASSSPRLSRAVPSAPWLGAGWGSRSQIAPRQL